LFPRADFAKQKHIATDLQVNPHPNAAKSFSFQRPMSLRVNSHFCTGLPELGLDHSLQGFGVEKGVKGRARQGGAAKPRP
jgi:hypothetical protein